MPESSPTVEGAPAPWPRGNTVEPAPPRRRRDPAAPDTEPTATLPPHIANRFFAQPGRFGRHVDYYEGSGARHPAFRDRGDRLETRRDDPAMVTVLLAIAQHRGWTTIRLRGDDDFRREAWIQAQALGVEVIGYRPKAHERAALAPRQEKARDPAPRASANSPVAGVFLEAGHAPYRGRKDRPQTPFVRIRTDNGREVRVWGADLPRAVKASHARPGERVVLERETATGSGSAEGRDKGAASRVRWRVIRDEPERSPATDAPPLTPAAQGRLAVIEAVAKARLADPSQTKIVVAAAQVQLARLAQQDRTVTMPKVGERTRAEPERTSRARDAPRERTRDR